MEIRTKKDLQEFCEKNFPKSSETCHKKPIDLDCKFTMIWTHGTPNQNKNKTGKATKTKSFI